MVKKIILGLLIVGMAGAFYVYFQYNKAHRDIVGEKASMEITAVDLFDAYVTDEAGANAKYLDKVIAVSGSILELDLKNQMVFLVTNDDFGTVNASFDEGVNLSGLVIGNEIAIKGHCTGGDDLGVVITHCSILK